MIEPYLHPIDVRYLEVDRQGVVFNMWYLAYVDSAFAGFLAHRGKPYPELMAGGLDVMLVRAELTWTAGLGFGDEVAVQVTPVTIGRTSLTIDYTVLRAREPTCRIRIVYVLVRLDGSGPTAVPQWLRTMLLDPQ